MSATLAAEPEALFALPRGGQGAVLLRGPVGGLDPGKGWLNKFLGEPLPNPLGCDGGEAPEAEYRDDSGPDLSITGLCGRSFNDSQLALLDVAFDTWSVKEGRLGFAPSVVAGLACRDRESTPPSPSSIRLANTAFGGVKERSREGGVYDCLLDWAVLSPSGRCN